MSPPAKSRRRLLVFLSLFAINAGIGVAHAEAPASRLALSLNKPAFLAGDTLVLSLINESGVAASGDLYLVVQLPDGSTYAFDRTQWLLVADGTRLVASAAKPFREKTSVAASSEPLLTVELASPIPSGIYTALAFLVKPGGNPLDRSHWESNLARTSFAFSSATFSAGPAFLTAGDVRAIVRQAAEANAATTMVVAVTDRQGHVLGLFRKPDAPAVVPGNFGQLVDARDQAVSLARTGALFSNDQAPLSSRTVRYISGIHFPPGIRNKPNAALYGVENTNRGCDLNTLFNPGKTIIPARSVNGGLCDSSHAGGCGRGIATGKPDLVDSDPGAVNGAGVPIYKDGVLVGGIGVTGIDPASAEFAAFTGSAPGPRFGPRPAAPGVIFLDGIALPFVDQKTPPPGSGSGVFSDDGFVLGPLDSPLGPAGPPDGWLVGPRGNVELTAADVERIAEQAVAVADRARAAIRLPLGSTSRMVIAVTGLRGEILGLFRMPDATIFSIDVSVAKARNVVFFSGPARLAEDLPEVPGGTAVTNRTIGFGAQPLYPAGIDGSSPGPFFHLYVDDVATPCRQGSQAPDPNQSGIVFFAGSLPLYRDGVLVGGLGVSGDGVEQDDLVAAAGVTGLAPPLAIRADEVFVRGVRLPFLKFPRNPFVE